LGTSQRPDDVFASPDQLAGELATLTLLPRSRWQTLLSLEVIQVGNEKHHPTAPRINLNKLHSSVHSLVATEQTKRTSETVGKGTILLTYPSRC